MDTTSKGARAIMGKNFFGVEEAIKHFGVNPSKRQLAYLAKVPFTKKVLKSCKDTHILVAVFPMSILDIRGKVSPEIFYDRDDAWYNKWAFAKDKGEVGWWLFRKVPVTEQQALLSKTEETLKAQVVVYTIVGHFIATGERLFENIYVRCSDLGSNGYRVYVVSFDAGDSLFLQGWDLLFFECLVVNRNGHISRDGSLQLFVARKQ